MVSFDRSLLKGGARRFLAKSAHPSSCESSFKGGNVLYCFWTHGAIETLHGAVRNTGGISLAQFQHRGAFIVPFPNLKNKILSLVKKGSVRHWPSAFVFIYMKAAECAIGYIPNDEALNMALTASILGGIR